MKKHKSYILIMIFFLSNAFSLQAMLNRLSRIPQAQPVPRRNISGLGKSKVRPSLLPLGGVNSRVNQNSFVNSAAKPLNSPTNSWF